jgi:hypothetical protein
MRDGTYTFQKTGENRPYAIDMRPCQMLAGATGSYTRVF